MRPRSRRARRSARVLAPPRRWALALGAALLGTGGAPLTAGCATAYALSRPALSVSLPGVKVPLPGVKVPVPGVEVSVPEATVTVPEVTVTVPEATVPLPGVTVSTPEVAVSTTGVSVSTPSVSTSSSGTTGTPPGEEPSGGGQPEGSSGETGPTSPSKPPSHGEAAGGSTGASASPAARAASLAAPATPTSTSSGGGRSHAATRRRADGTTRARGARRRTPPSAPPAGALAPAAFAGAGAGRTSRGASTSTGGGGNPLDSIGRQIPLPIPVPDWSKPIILALLALALWLGVRARIAVRRARRLERQRATLLRDVGAMQAALVPDIPPRVGGLAVSVAYRPAEGPAAGGDFYDVFAPERGKVAIILGDVAGHGHQALTRAALTRYTLRAYLQAGLEPRAAIALAGHALADPSADRYATVVVAVYSTRDGCLTYASAGHPPPILHGLRTREPLSVCASAPVGWTVPTGRRQTTVSLPRGAVACFFSDGLIEARCEDGLLERERLSDLLDGLGSRPDAEKLLSRVRGATLATPDDMAACVISPEVALVGAPTHVEELEVDLDAINGRQARRFLETCQVPAADIERTIARAGDIAAVFTTALLRAELTSTDASVVALAPGPAPEAAGGRASQPAGEPSGAR